MCWDTTLPAPKWGADDFCKYHEIQLRTEGRSLLRGYLSTQQYFGLLLENRCYADARRVLAHALPKRRALWWGCLCAWDLYRPQPPEVVDQVLQAVVRFVLEPSEGNRQATAECAKAVEPNTLAHCLAMAAFCSAGSIAPEGLPCVDPRPFITGRLVGVAVYLASVLRNPAQYLDRLRQYLAIGVEVSQGTNLWTDGRAIVPLEEETSSLEQIPTTEVAPVGETIEIPVGLTGLVAEGLLVQTVTVDQENLVAVS
jgi:hypothetical protein